MSKKDTDFSKSVMVRIYDTVLVQELGKIYAGGNFDSKNGFLTELIESGFAHREQDESYRTELSRFSDSFDARLSAIEKQQSEFQATAYKQFAELKRNDETAEQALGAIYSVLLAIYSGYDIPQKELECGLYDYLPKRFRSAA